MAGAAAEERAERHIRRPPRWQPQRWRTELECASFILIGLKRGFWINARGTKCRNAARRRRDDQERTDHDSKYRRVARRLIEQQRRDPLPGDERDRTAGDDPR